MGGKKGKTIANATEGIFAYTVDVALWLTVYLTHAAALQSRHRALSRAVWQADIFLDRWNYHTLRDAFNQARRVGLIKRSGRGRRTLPEITQAGRKRLEALLPSYHTKRVWDGRLYLITYDIPEKRRKDRDVLRSFIQQLGMGMLQESVWITPYDPRELLRKIVDDHHIAGSILVSDIGKDGSVGDEKIEDLLIRVYHLEDLNKRYEEFIDYFQKGEKVGAHLYFSYLSILRVDPQLPFPLLPKWWKGDVANNLFNKRIVNKITTAP